MVRVALAVLLLVVLAGCSGLAADRPPEPTATVTPVPVPDDGADAPSVSLLAPGLTRDGVVDPLALANAHAAVVGNRSHVLYARWTVRAANGTVRGEVVQRTAVEPGGAFRANVSVRGRTGIVADRPTTAVFWSDGEELVERARANGTTRYLYIPADEYSGGNGFYNSLRRPKPWRDIYALFASIETRVASTQAGPGGDGTVYLLEGTRLADPTLFAAATDTTDPRNVTFTAAVDDDGLVRGQRLTYTATAGGETVEVTRVVRYSRFGEVRVERPEWYQRAKEESVRRSRGSDPAPGLGPDWVGPR
jgi:hypothetical protein